MPGRQTLMAMTERRASGDDSGNCTGGGEGKGPSLIEGTNVACQGHWAGDTQDYRALTRRRPWRNPLVRKAIA
jgi:hypothetical protein